MMDEKKLEDLMTMKLEERWQELLADADGAIQQEEDRIEARMNPRKNSEKKDETDRAEEK